MKMLSIYSIYTFIYPQQINCRHILISPVSGTNKLNLNPKNVKATRYYKNTYIQIKDICIYYIRGALIYEYIQPLQSSSSSSFVKFVFPHRYKYNLIKKIQICFNSNALFFYHILAKRMLVQVYSYTIFYISQANVYIKAHLQFFFSQSAFKYTKHNLDI